MNDPTGFDALRSAEAGFSKRFGRKVVLHRKKSWFKRLPGRRLSSAAQYVLFLGGIAAITYGFFMIYRPLGPLVGGLIAASLGMLLSSDEDESGKQSTQSR